MRSTFYTSLHRSQKNSSQQDVSAVWMTNLNALRKVLVCCVAALLHGTRKRNYWTTVRDTGRYFFNRNNCELHEKHIDFYVQQDRSHGSSLYWTKRETFTHATEPIATFSFHYERKSPCWRVKHIAGVATSVSLFENGYVESAVAIYHGCLNVRY